MIQNLFLSFTAILPGYRVYIGVSSKKKALAENKKISAKRRRKKK